MIRQYGLFTLLFALFWPRIALTDSNWRADSIRELIRARACEIQRRERIAPTLCYTAELAGQAELDSLCLAYSARATRLPKVSRSTSKVCRDAIETRAKDLAYMSGGAASR